jgi:hypothetical protein
MKRMTIVAGLFLASAMSVMAAFVDPTPAQFEAASKDPALVAALLKDASPEQAAQVIKAIIVGILGQGLNGSTANAQITAVVNAGFAAMPAGTGVQLSAALGTACGSTAAISGNPTVVSAIQNAVATAGGASGAALAAQFGSAYSAAVEGASKNVNNKDSPPPIASGYPGQK